MLDLRREHSSCLEVMFLNCIFAVLWVRVRMGHVGPSLCTM